jgi:hypothetical protein
MPIAIQQMLKFINTIVSQRRSRENTITAFRDHHDCLPNELTSGVFYE